MAIDVKELSRSYPLLNFEETLNPTWGEDAGRNSNSGKFSGTFVGYFTGLHFEFGRTTPQQMTDLKAIFDVPIQTFKYPTSNNNGSYYTEDFYGTAIKVTTETWGKKYKPFSVDLVAVEARNDV